jgi:hypothetical protein
LRLTPTVVRSALLTGTVASLATTAALTLLAKAEGKRSVQPTNSTSHWLHGESAGHVRRVDAAHTAVGYLTHHASAIFWALLFEAWLADRPPRSPGHMLANAAGMASIAAAIDYGVTPKRLTPGWEAVLPKRSIVATFGVLALGLAAGALASQNLRQVKRR